MKILRLFLLPVAIATYFLKSLQFWFVNEEGVHVSVFIILKIQLKSHI